MQNKHHKSYCRYLLIAGMFALSLYSTNGVAMSLIFGTEVVLFPPMTGSLTYEGNPAANAKIVVHVFWKDEIGVKDEFHANEQGQFAIPEKKAKIRIPPLAEFVVTQQITVFFQQKEFVVWSKASMGTDQYGGLGGNPKNVRCELTEKRKKQQDFDGLFSTSCTWELTTESGDKK